MFFPFYYYFTNIFLGNASKTPSHQTDASDQHQMAPAAPEGSPPPQRRVTTTKPAAAAGARLSRHDAPGMLFLFFILILLMIT